MTQSSRFRAQAAGLVLALLCGVATGQELTNSQDAPAVTAELAKLAGTWQLLYAETDGVAAPAERLAQIRITFTGATHTVRFGEQVIAAAIPFRLDPAATPARTEDRIHPTTGPDTTIRGIYRLEGDLLVSCVGQPDAPRPPEFRTEAGSGHTLRIFRRVREAEDARGRAIAAELGRLDGSWRVETRKLNGRAIPPTAFTGSVLTLDGGRFRMTEPSGDLAGFIVIDPTTDPSRMDVVYTEGRLRGRVTRALYRLGDQTYTFCFGVTNGDRPTSFDSPAGGGQGVDILKRVRP